MKRIISLVLAVFMLIGSTMAFFSCGDDDYTAQDLQDAKSRYFSGKASKSDKRMVEGFYDWKANQ